MSNMRVVPARSLAGRTSLKSARAVADGADGAVQGGSFSQRMALNEEFGSTKARKAVREARESRLAMAQASPRKDGKVVLDAVASAVLRSMDGVTASMASQEELQQEADAAKPRPAMKLDATDVADVFSLEDLVGADGLGLMDVRPWHDAVGNKKDVLSSSKFVIERVVSVVSKGKKELKRSQHDRLLRYYSLLIDWYRVLIRKRDHWKVPKREELQNLLPDMDSRIFDKICKRFAPNL